MFTRVECLARNEAYHSLPALLRDRWVEAKRIRRTPVARLCKPCGGAVEVSGGGLPAVRDVIAPAPSAIRPALVTETRETLMRVMRLLTLESHASAMRDARDWTGAWCTFQSLDWPRAT